MENNGINVYMGICPVCMKENGEILIGGKQKHNNSDSMYAFSNMCEKCNDNIKNGYVAVIEIKNEGNYNIFNAPRTGRLAFIRKNLLKNCNTINFCTKDFFDFIEEKHNELLEESEE